jgi:hypothetical protein
MTLLRRATNRVHSLANQCKHNSFGFIALKPWLDRSEKSLREQEIPQQRGPQASVVQSAPLSVNAWNLNKLQVSSEAKMS